MASCLNNVDLRFGFLRLQSPPHSIRTGPGYSLPPVLFLGRPLVISNSDDFLGLLALVPVGSPVADVEHCRTVEEGTCFLGESQGGGKNHRFFPLV